MADGPRMPAFENPYAGCAMGPPPKELTMDQRMEWARLVQACAAPQWLVGVRGTVTTRFGFKKTTVYIERYVFAWNYEAASAVSR
jgi:hypothetical protein